MSRKAERNITNADCRETVTKRVRIYDRDCSGLYVTLSPTAPPTFSMKYSFNKKRGNQKLGVFLEGGDGVAARDVLYWRGEAFRQRGRLLRGEDIAATTRQAQRQQIKQGITIDKLIDGRIAWVSEVIGHHRQTENGRITKMKPRFKDHANMAAHLNRFVRPRLGWMVASEVTRADIQQLQKDILAGTLITNKGKTTKKDSVSSARHMRKAVSGLFKWAAQEDYVTTSPCVNLSSLPEEPPRIVKLTPREIRILWHGLDRPDIVVDRKICLAIKFTLVSALRSWELLGIHSRELGRNGLNGKLPLVVIPEERVKSGRDIHQPLSDLAVEIAKEAMGNYPWMFAGRFGDEPLNKKAMSCALRGKTKRVNGKKVVVSVGLCDQLGLRRFTPHDLRRTAASLMGDIKVPRSIISLCCDHTIKKDEHGAVAAVTGKHYDQSLRIDEKREALQKLADEIRRIVGEPMQRQEEMRQAA
jgi:integrase